jgi:uncharacterized protein (DUF58 family)
MQQRYLSPSVLASISGLDLVAKTVVDGFISGLHRSPDFGFSQEFAEYQSYNPGDDLRHVDWNVFARSERMYLKKFRGETNSQLTILLDTSNSMTFSSHGTDKLEYSRYLAASLAYLASQQRDAVGLLVFDDEVRDYVPPSARQGQLHRIMHAIEHAKPGKHTDFARPFVHCQEFLHRRGVVVVFSDFYEDPEVIKNAILPLRAKCTEVVVFHVLDPEEIKPKLGEPVILLDMETQASIEVSPDYARNEYAERIGAHIAKLKEKVQGAGMDYHLVPTDRPLDASLREYLTIRKGRM